MKNSRAFPWLYALAVIVVAGMLAFLFWDFIHDAIVYPLYYLGWLGLLVINSLSQDVYLVLLVTAALVVGIIVVARLTTQTQMEQPARETNASQSRYRFWRSKSGELDTSEYFRHNFAVEARRLVLETLAHQEGISMTEADIRVRDGLIRLPPEVRYLVEHRELQGTANASPRRRRIFGYKNKTLSAESRLLADRQVESILNFLEERLEMKHD